jgi:hypothetical protein
MIFDKEEIVMKTKTIKFNDFMNGSFRENDKLRKQKIIKNTVSVASSIGIPLLLTGGIGAVGLAMTGVRTFAATTSSIPSGVAIPVGASEYISDSALRTLAHALDPLVDILVAISLPVASVVMVGGCFFFMLGNSEKAWSMIQNAGLGYVLIQLSPLFVKVLEQVGRAV